MPASGILSGIRFLFLFCLLGCVLAGCARPSLDPAEQASVGSVSPAEFAVAPSHKESVAEKVAAEAAFDREQAIDSAIGWIESGQVERAATELQQVLIRDPGDVEVLFRLARLKADQGDYRTAVELLDSIPNDHPEAGLPALGQGADWCMALEQYEAAEARYRKLLELAGDVAVVHRQLAHLFNRQGRRFEAVEHLRALCRLGDIQQDELHALMVVGHAIFDDPNQPSGKSRPNYPIGPAATARMLYTAGRFAEAVDALDESVRSGQAVPSILAFYGLLAIEAQDMERFGWWLNRADDAVQSFAEYWAAIGAYLVLEGRYAEAVRALGEALWRDPSNLGARRRIHQSLIALGQTDEADRWSQQYEVLRKVILASNAIGKSELPDLESYRTVAEGLDELHRPLEASTWRLVEAFHRKASPEEIERLNQQRRDWLQSEEAFSNRQHRLCGIDLDQYPLPELEVPKIVSLPPRRGDPITDGHPRPRFENVAEQIGLHHTYFVASEPQPFRFALYQSLGGGVAVLDYDCDGAVDLYLAQGGADPPSMVGELSNLLYRGVDGLLADATNAANLIENRYSIGVTSGDWNQDGFPDLVVTNIGNKVLLINNGDGTFQSRVFDEDPAHRVLSSSVALADVSGDGLPDIVSLHYVEDQGMLDRPGVDEQGDILTVSPSSFQAGLDSIAVNDGRGGMLRQRISDSEADASTGLGIVIADWDGEAGNEIFVGNDIRANQLWKRSPGNGSWTDQAAIRGCALGVGGVATASMGIAVADFDGNGMMDIHITNFYLEPVSLYMNRGGLFQDRCLQYGLHRDSSSVLGFGSQAIDYDLDGRPDLVVTNGNIEKAPGEPLEQPPQLFINLGDRFRLSEVDDRSGYWQGKYLGRALARLDFNRDGQPDFLITHIGSPTALMINRTDSGNHWLSFRLVGTECERDAIGTQVEVHVGDRILTHWLVGGDGYLCRNEQAVLFGLGREVSEVRVVITWPRGNRQEFDGVSVDQRLLVVEGDSELFAETPKRP